MRQLVLSMVVFSIGLWFAPGAFADNHRLWIEQSKQDGGDLKTWMIQQKLATEAGFTCGKLLDVVWNIAKRRGIAREVRFPEAQAEFTQFLANWFFTTSTLPCENLETELTWTQFGEIGRTQGGYPPFDSEVVQQAIMTAEANAQVVQQTQAAPLIVTPMSVRRLPIIQGNSPLRNERGNLAFIQLDPDPLPTQAELAAAAAADDKADREEAAAAARVVEEELKMQQDAADHEAEMLQLYRELEKKEVQDRINFLSKLPVTTASSHIENAVVHYFQDIPEMVEAAWCETKFKNEQSKIIDENGDQERSFGPFQINEPTWHDIAIDMGLPNYQTDVMENLIMARHVYAEQGISAFHAYPCKRS